MYKIILVNRINGQKILLVCWLYGMLNLARLLKVEVSLFVKQLYGFQVINDLNHL